VVEMLINIVNIEIFEGATFDSIKLALESSLGISITLRNVNGSRCSNSVTCKLCTDAPFCRAKLGQGYPHKGKKFITIFTKSTLFL
jgi:hypothetical protein